MISTVVLVMSVWSCRYRLALLERKVFKRLGEEPPDTSSLWFDTLQLAAVVVLAFVDEWRR